ncbi:MAG: transcription termination/antitermination protein NusA, partial [Muribaculaceae bacterium]|nr:transcription termination/antitermination protein NusA [Muribaculaceae bacterium]
MAKKAENTNMVERFDELKEYKHIDKATMVSVLEESFRKVLSSMFGTDENLDVIMNPDKGDVQIFQNLEVVPDGEVQNPYLQISLTDARADNDPDAEIGEEHTKEIIFADFGRRAILNLRQTLQSKILDLQKEAIYSKFKDLEGELISAEVYQTWSRETLLMDEDHNELLLPKSESIPGDYFRKGETVRAVIANVENKNNNPKIMVSRVSDQFLRALFELEVPEIHDGLINIRAVARIPGERAKIAVESYDDRIDPVGACV